MRFNIDIMTTKMDNRVPGFSNAFDALNAGGVLNDA